MSVEFIAGEGTVWSALSNAAKRSRRADVAVAYFGQGSARRLPLGNGSRLVVDASEATVRTGATCPAELLALLRRGVEVHSQPGLHAKVFVFGRAAFVGSANVSSASAERLTEAMIRTTELETVQAARRFVTEMASGVPLGPEALTRLQSLYRPPRSSGAIAPRRLQRAPRVWFEWYAVDDPPAGSEEFVVELLREAKKMGRHERNFELVETWRSGAPRYALNDMVIMTEGDGLAEKVAPPARVVHVKTWANGRSRTTFSVMELAEKRQIAKHRLVKKLGRGWKKTLGRYGRMNRQDAATLVAWWNERN